MPETARWRVETTQMRRKGPRLRKTMLLQIWRACCPVSAVAVFLLCTFFAGHPAGRVHSFFIYIFYYLPAKAVKIREQHQSKSRSSERTLLTSLFSAAPYSGRIIRRNPDFSGFVQTGCCLSCQMVVLPTGIMVLLGYTKYIERKSERRYGYGQKTRYNEAGA